MAKFNRSMQVEGKLVVDEKSFAAGIRRAVRDTDKLNRAAKQTGKNNGFRSIGRAALGAAAGIGAVTIAADQLRRSITDTVDLAKATRQLQRATGLASEEASALAGVLKVRGVNTDKLGRSFVTLARNVEAAKTGVGGAAEAFTKLGVSQRAIQAGNVNQILIEASDGFQKLGDGTSKAAIAQQLFGRNSRDLIPLLEGGSQKLREQLALAPQLSDAQVKQSLATVTAQRQIQLAMLNVRTTIGTALMPTIAQGAEKLGKFVTEMKTGKGAGGEFAAQVKEIWKSIKPAAEQLVRFTRAAFKFAAENPGLVKIAATFAAIGLAIKGIKFVSAISGLSTFLTTAKGLGGPLKKLFSRFGTRAGGAFAAEASGSMAGNMAGSLAPAGRMGKMAGKNGSFAKWGRLAGRAAGVAFAAAMIYIIYEEVKALWNSNLINPQDISRKQDLRPGTDKFNEARKFGTREGDEIRRRRDRRRNPRGRGSSRPMARGSARGVGGIQAPSSERRSPYGTLDLGDTSDYLDAALSLAEQRADAAQARAERFERTIGSKTSKGEARQLRELQRLAAQAAKEVDKLQSKISRREALLEIKDQFKAWGQGFVEAFSQGLDNIANARLSAAQKLAQKTLDAQLDALDEEEGQSEEARRLRELRTQQEFESKAREDQDYAKQKLALETDLERAIRNGNVRGQAELKAQIETLDQQRRDVLRSREIADLSDSLQRQRQAAQDEYEARIEKAQEYYDDQVEKNRQAVADYKARIDEQIKLLTDQLDAGKISYQDFNTEVNRLAGVLTADLKSQLDTRAINERDQLAGDKTAYGDYIRDANKIFDGLVKDLPVPDIPQPPDIRVKVWLDIQNPIDGMPSQGTPPSGGGGSPQPAKRPISQLKSFLRAEQNKKPKETYKPTASYLAGLFAFANKSDVMQWEKDNKAWLKREKVDIVNRVSGGPLAFGPGALTLVGEAGPELIMSGTGGGQVMSATRTARTAGAQGVTLNVYPQTTADDPVALARALGWQLANR